MEEQKRLGARIRLERRKRLYSQESFAEQCGLHRTYIGAVERGEINISLQNLVVVAKALEIKLSELFALEDL